MRTARGAASGLRAPTPASVACRAAVRTRAPASAAPRSRPRWSARASASGSSSSDSSSMGGASDRRGGYVRRGAAPVRCGRAGARCGCGAGSGLVAGRGWWPGAWGREVPDRVGHRGAGAGVTAREGPGRVPVVRMVAGGGPGRFRSRGPPTGDAEGGRRWAAAGWVWSGGGWSCGAGGLSAVGGGRVVVLWCQWLSAGRLPGGAVIRVACG